MLDQKIFGEKLRNHRKNIGFSQEEVAKKIGVSAQAISKWENGECLPDCFNLKSISEIYGISADLLLETETANDIDCVAAKIEQLADEYIWTKSALNRYSGAESAHRDLGEDLLKFWKGIYFVETGSKERQKLDKERGNLRIKSDFGMKVWDDDGIVAVVNNKIFDRLGAVGEREYLLMKTLCSQDCIRLITAFSRQECAIAKEKLVEKSGIEPSRLNEILLILLEAGVIEYVSKDVHNPNSGYKISGHFGIAAYLVIATMYLLSKTSYTVSEYININVADPE